MTFALQISLRKQPQLAVPPLFCDKTDHLLIVSLPQSQIQRHRRSLLLPFLMLPTSSKIRSRPRRLFLKSFGFNYSLSLI